MHGAVRGHIAAGRWFDIGHVHRNDRVAVLDGPADEAERDVALALTRTVPGLVDVRFARGGAV